MEFVVTKETISALEREGPAFSTQRGSYQNDPKPRCDPQLSRPILVPSSITQKWRETAPEGPFKAKVTLGTAKVTHMDT